MFNRSEETVKISIDSRMLGMYGEKKVRDLWRQKDVGTIDHDRKFTAEVAPHGVVLVKVYPGNTTEAQVGEVMY